jgi:hypothetical protein
VLQIRVYYKFKENILELLGDNCTWNNLETVKWNKVCKKYQNMKLLTKNSYEAIPGSH